MGFISHDDVEVIIKGAIKMAQQDSDIADQEVNLIKKLMEAGNVDSGAYSNFETAVDESIDQLAGKLKSPRAKKVFLLTLAAVAFADKRFESQEQQFLDQMTDMLKIGKVKLDQHTYEACEKEVIKLLSMAD